MMTPPNEPINQACLRFQRFQRSVSLFFNDVYVEDLVKRVVPQLIEYGSVTLPSLNITAADPNVGKQLGVKSQGMLVQAVAPGSAAAAAGWGATR
jgi:hypothetical protein